MTSFAPAKSISLQTLLEYNLIDDSMDSKILDHLHLQDCSMKNITASHLLVLFKSESEIARERISRSLIFQLLIKSYDQNVIEFKEFMSRLTAVQVILLFPKFLNHLRGKYGAATIEHVLLISNFLTPNTTLVFLRQCQLFFKNKPLYLPKRSKTKQPERREKMDPMEEALQFLSQKNPCEK